MLSFMLVPTSVRVANAATKHHDQEAHWEGRVYSAYTSASLFMAEGQETRPAIRDEDVFRLLIVSSVLVNDFKNIFTGRK